MKNHDRIYIYPTDTVWGIGASIHSVEAHDQIAQIKRTEPGKPLSILFTGFQLFKEYLNLPDFMTDQWLQGFFSLETTIMLPLAYLKKEIPSWIIQKSDLLACRVLTFKPDDHFLNKLDVPITTTSLNITGEPPVISFMEAKKFHDQYARSALFLAAESPIPSGESSSMVKFDETKTLVIVRKGRWSHKINEYLRV